MTNGLFDLNRSPRPGLAAPDFFYSNLRIQETLTTIRYGIEARKGLTVVTGAPGVGKSALLRKAAEELAGSITCIVESDPRVGFRDILRLILRNLGADPSEQEEPDLVRNCRLELRSRLDRCQIVALFLDNAHQFPDQTLRHITQNFLAGSAEDPDGTLLQVVLVGRPGLRTKLAQSTLTGLRRRKPIVCDLQPLNSGEIGAFIKKGLETVDGAGDIFDERAIKRIGLYANGNPGAVQAICARALELAKDENAATVSAELIESAVGDLDLRQFGDSGDSESFSAPGRTLDFDGPKRFQALGSNDHEFGFSPAEKVSMMAAFPAHAEEMNWPPAKHRNAWTRRLTILIILVGAVAMIPKDTALDLASNWHAAWNRIMTPSVQPPAKPETPAEASAQKPDAIEPLVPLPGPDRPADIHENTLPPSAKKTDPPLANPSSPAPAERQAQATPKIPRLAPQERRPPAKIDSSQQNEILQNQIAKAIESRAIMGVEVSVVHGTAYLDGHVASERQRRAAERAARSVAGVERVRNRIAITFG